ncbi:MAG: cation:proton antiporter [Ignavibacteriaceae bacterium]|nr:cation:proton antiporter [Ignavibacteriaceae bacterium]
MQQFSIIRDIVLILLVSIPIIFIFNKLKLPSIVGFLVAGIFIGPHGFQLISNITEIEVMAEIGVILLLFVIGLEVSFDQLLKMKKFLLLAGGLQLIGTIFLSGLLFYLIGINLSQSIFLAMLLSLSSTAIVLKLLSDRRELDAPHGRIALSILIFQDLAIVPMFIALPILGSEGAMSGLDILLNLVFAFGVIILIFIAAKYLMPLVMEMLVKLKMREAFTVGILLLLLGTAYLTHSAGLSFALGAFIAGLILSESDYSHQIVAEIIPLKDAFNSIFFVSVGLLLDIRFILQFPFTFLAITIGVIVLKAFVIVSIVKYLKYPLRTAVLSGLGLAQIGEFSFVLAQSGMGYQLIPEMYYNAFLASSIFTMILTPFLFILAPYIAQWFGDIEPVKIVKGNELSLKQHVIIVGFGLNGKNLARVLKETGIKYIIVEMNPDTFKEQKQKGERIIYGDITREEILHQTYIMDAKL